MTKWEKYKQKHHLTKKIKNGVDRYKISKCKWVQKKKQRPLSSEGRHLAYTQKARH